MIFLPPPPEEKLHRIQACFLFDQGTSPLFVSPLLPKEQSGNPYLTSKLSFFSISPTALTANCPNSWRQLSDILEVGPLIPIAQ